MMASWTHLIRFVAEEDGKPYFATCDAKLLNIGEQVKGFQSFAELENANGGNTKTYTIKEVRRLVLLRGP